MLWAPPGRPTFRTGQITCQALPGAGASSLPSRVAGAHTASQLAFLLGRELLGG